MVRIGASHGTQLVWPHWATHHCRLATAEQLIELSAAMELLRTHSAEAQAEGILRVWRGIHPSLGLSVLSPVHLRWEAAASRLQQ